MNMIFRILAVIVAFLFMAVTIASIIILLKWVITGSRRAEKK